MDQPDKDTLWYQSNLDVFLNRWYSSYADARKARENHGGFLLPYKSHFFVCEADVIRALGLEPDDPDWEKTVGMLRNLRTWRCVSVCVRSE